MRVTRSAVLGPSWWAAGLTLDERSPAVPTTVTVPGPLHRLDRWSAAYGPAGDERFAQRLADLGLDRRRLVGLLAESPEALAARHSRPAWARLVEQVIADAPPDREPARHRPATGLATLVPALRPFVDFATTELHGWVERRGIADVDLPRVCAGFGDQLGIMLARIAARTLVLQLNLARNAGRLTGATAEARFDDFVAGMGTAAGMCALFGEYPVLGRLLAQACRHAVAAHQDVLVRFAADRAAIVGTLLAADPGRLVAVDAGTGDRHRAGRSVAILRFDRSSVVYKPRSVALQEHFQDFVAWLNTRAPELGLRLIRSLDRDGYAWQEFVEHQPCTDTAGLARFYRRQGALLALLHALNGTDIHYENVIASGDQPVVVDVETLFQPAVLAPAATGVDPAAHALASSVAATALLPVLLLGERGALDISGLGGDRQVVVPTDLVAWADAGTDRMRLVRRGVEFAGGANRPRLADTDAEPRDYTDALLAGFRTAYHAITRGRGDLLAMVGRCAHDEIRVLARSTMDYATLLDESTHPDVLRDGLDRDAALDTMWADAPNDLARVLAPHEVADLWLGDVPMFRATPGSTDLRTARDEPVPGVLDGSGLDRVVTKITGLGELDRQRQEWVIRAALAARASGRWHTPGPLLPGAVAAVLPDPARLLSCACGVADEIVADALHDGDRANWLGVQPIDDECWSLLPMGAGLADGYCGVALFLAQLGALTGVTRYTELARRAITPIPRLLDALAADAEQVLVVGCGGFAGLGGIGYALARLSVLLDDTEIRGWLATVVPLIGIAGAGPDVVADPGVSGGLAGGVAALRAVHAETGLAAAADWAGVLANRLADTALPRRTGFLTGRHGVEWALAGFAAARRPAAAPEPAEDFGWCHGLAGILLAGTPDVESVDRFVRLLAGRRSTQDMSLCHGELGVLEALTVVARHHEQAAAAKARGTAFLLGALEKFGPRCGTPDGVPVPGLLAGLAGIGYGLLRLGFAARVPSVLLLEPSKGCT